MRPPCTALGLATFLGWLALGASWQTALTYAIAVLIITCPCALALAVPAVQIAAASRLFRQGIMVKAADGLERLAETDMVVFDKTGTLDARPARAARMWTDSRTQCLRRRPRSPRSSRHPYARAIVAAASGGCGTVAAARNRGDAGRGTRGARTPGEERLGSADWCGAQSSGRGQRGLVPAGHRSRRSASASPIAQSDAAMSSPIAEAPGLLAVACSRATARPWSRRSPAGARHRDVACRAEARRQDRLARSRANRGPQGADGGRRAQRCPGACRRARLDLAGERRRHQPARRRLRVPGREARAGADGNRHRAAGRGPWPCRTSPSPSSTTSFACRWPWRASSRR